MKTTFFLSFFLVNIICFSQPLQLQWAHQWGSSSSGDLNETVNDVKIDFQGNIITIGSFGGTSDFDPGSGTTNITTNGGYDLFIKKQSPNGDLIWVRRIGGTDDEFAGSFDADGQGNIFITGYFRGTIDFDPGTGTNNISSNGSRDIFIVRINSDGSFGWAGGIGISSDEVGFGITSAPNGNIYITGTFSGPVDFDPSSGVSLVSGSNGAFDIYLAAYNGSTGAYLWGNAIGGTGYDNGYSMESDAQSNIYVSGSFQNSFDFNPGVGSAVITSAGGADIFLAKFQPNGTLSWVKTIGGTAGEYSGKINLDNLGNIALTGSFQGTCDFDPGVGSTNLISAGGYDAFLAKYSSTGNLVFAGKIGGNQDYSATYSDIGNDVEFDSDGNMYFIGNFCGTVDLNPGSGTQTATINGQVNDMFIVKLDPQGSFIWAFSQGSSFLDDGSSLAISSQKSIYIGGEFQLIMDFDPSPGTFNIQSTGSINMFLQRIDQCISTTNSISATACNSFSLNGQTYSSSGSYTQTLINSSGCDSILTINLTINSVSATVVPSGNFAIAQPANATAYQWVDCNNGSAPIPNQTNQSFFAASSGNYAVIVTQNNCSDTSACVSLITSIENYVYSEKSTLLFPNPTSGDIQIKTEKKIEDVQLVDVAGRIVPCLLKADNRLDLNKFDSGLYWVHIKTVDGIVIQKVVRQ
jgi:hypothetical protein